MNVGVVLLVIMLLKNVDAMSGYSNLSGTDAMGSADPVYRYVVSSKFKMQPLTKLQIVGEFERAGKLDTLSQHLFSGSERQEITEYPVQMDWDTLVVWFESKDPHLYVSFNDPGKDTLALGFGQGLYCLINLGKINGSKTDLLALVVDYLDFSRLNSCTIYGIKDKKWKAFFQFDVNESAFDFYGENQPVFRDIPGFLEKRKNQWVYKLNLDDQCDDESCAHRMKPLHFKVK